MKKQYINRRGELVYLDDDVAPEGFGVRVSAFLMDGVADDVQAAIATTTTRARITDCAGRPAGSRPGFCYDATSNNETQARIAYDQMVARNQPNWRGPNTAHAISDAATPEASFAAYQAYLKDAWRTPVADQTSQEKRRKLDNNETERDNDVERAREAYRQKISTAWMNTKGVGFGPGSFGG